MIEITEQDFDINEMVRNLKNEGVGAIVTFIGTVRGFAEKSEADGQNKGKEVKQLVYECYRDMALEKMEQIRGYALTNYDIKDMDIIHRIGVLKPADKIVAIAVTAVHRNEAFKACEYAIEELKKSVPIWKKEVTAEKEYWVMENGKNGGHKR